MELSAAFQTLQTGDLCIVKDIIQQDSRDHEFVDPEAKKAEKVTARHSGVTDTFWMFSCIWYFCVLITESVS